MDKNQVSIDSTHGAAVDKSYHWRPIDDNTPMGVKIQLINEHTGVAVYGQWVGNRFFTHWAPLPTFRKSDGLG
jgi:hypothetical protein